jgi:hypothetical protein
MSTVLAADPHRALEPVEVLEDFAAQVRIEARLA